MNIAIDKCRNIVNEVLLKWGFPEKDALVMLDNMTEAELSGKKSHGFTNLFWYKDVVAGKYGPLNKNGAEPSTAKETKISLVINGQEKTGYVVMQYAMDQSLQKVKDLGFISTALTRTAPTIGFIGSFAKRAAKEGYIFICFSGAGNSTSPYGVTKKMVGTNPIAIGIPTGGVPIILDMATAATTYANLLRSKTLGLPISENVGIEASGNLTNSPDAVLDGGSLIPFGGYKGSGISIMVELLAGALTDSKLGPNNIPYWGTFFILLDPTLFQDRNEFHKEVITYRDQLKNSPKRPGFEDVYLPGEKSQRVYEETLKTGVINIDDNFFDRLKKIAF